ncbi:MAG TPA: co-chaperone GroES [Bacteroidia bacterium]|nr:co-chaperone GroES [Sphingobacteriales bacterium]HPD64227.1 co-chaperone GroES [Bacteroidia bacterium]HRS57967.1 co-chaperone GroES [Bacteroidia bacterium]HRU68010.1 co-chaperone GroES [Bacteroidia bacterium]
MKELQPLGQNVLLDLSENLVPEKTAGGIIIPDTAKEKPLFSRVVAIGNVEDCEVNTGDLVFYKRFSGTEIEFEGKKYLSVPYSELLAKIVETEAI